MLHSDVFPFLKALKENNTRKWFKANKDQHDATRKHVLLFSDRLFQLLKDENQLDKHKVFRIYRDVRFSKNKTPYKTHFGISFHRSKPKFRGGYYLHIEPGGSFLATGFWKPNKDDLFRVRKEIEFDQGQFAKMATLPALVKQWNPLQGEQLKTAPKGFEKDHPGIEYLRYKQFLFMQNIDDDALFESKFGLWMVEQFKAVKPFHNYMGDVLTTDLNGESIL